MSDKPRALELADSLEFRTGVVTAKQSAECTAALRRLVGQVRELREALERIKAIENKDFGLDWEEIEEARAIAEAVLTNTKD